MPGVVTPAPQLMEEPRLREAPSHGHKAELEAVSSVCCCSPSLSHLDKFTCCVLEMSSEQQDVSTWACC